MTINTFNTIPVAVAGPNQLVHPRDMVTLDGGGSSDPENDSITYFWSITQKPSGSTAELSDAYSPTPTFAADIHSDTDYVITLTVTDEFGDASNPDSLTVSFENIKPVAITGQDQSVMQGDTVSLDGSASSDNNGDLLSYSWSFASKPEGSTAVFTDPTTAQTGFVTDEPGTYVISLVVNDGFEDSDAANVTVTAVSPHFSQRH